MVNDTSISAAEAVAHKNLLILIGLVFVTI